MIQVFKSVKVRPHWGFNQVVVTWEVPKELFQGNFIVMRSVDGITGFTEVASGRGIDHFVDKVVGKDRITEFYYRITLQHKGARYDSDVVFTGGEAGRTIFGMAHQIMKLEHLRMRRCHSVKIYRQKLSGEICPVCTDADTEQRIGASVCEQCFGTGILGGYEEPVDSHMLIVSYSAIELKDNASGAGTDDPSEENARILPYPPLRKNDMLVHPDMDKRWLVNTLTPYYVSDTVPVLYDAVLMMMRRNDIRYKVK